MHRGDGPLHVAFPHRIDSLDVQRLLMGFVVQPAAIHLGGIVDFRFQVFPTEIGYDIRVGTHAQIIEIFPQAGGVLPNFFFFLPRNIDAGGAAVFVQGVLDGKPGAGGDFQFDIIVTHGPLQVDVAVQVEIIALRCNPVFPGIAGNVVDVHDRPASGGVPRLEHDPGIDLIVADGLELKGTSQDAAAGRETAEGLEPGLQLVFVHRGDFVIIGHIFHILHAAVKRHGVILRPVVLILVQNPGGIVPMGVGRPRELRFDAGGKGLGVGGLVGDVQFLVFVGHSGVVRGFGLPLAINRSDPAEFLFLVIQLELAFREPVNHGLVIGDDAARYSAQAGR